LIFKFLSLNKIYENNSDVKRTFNTVVNSGVFVRWTKNNVGTPTSILLEIKRNSNLVFICLPVKVMKIHMFNGKSIIITNLKLPGWKRNRFIRVYTTNNNNILFRYV